MLDELEETRLEILGQVNSIKTKAQRNRLGQFGTPPALASEIIGLALSFLPAHQKIRFLEPGFGTGAFYSALLHQIPATRLETATGYEIDTDYAESAKRLWGKTGLTLHIADFVKTEPPQTEIAKYNLLACNPPYVRHHHLSQSQKLELQHAVRHHFNFELNGLSGLYAYFIILSQVWMAKDAIGAWLVPSEFMDVNYGLKVKEFLTGKVTLQRIHRFDPNEIQFGDASVSSSVIVIKNTVPLSSHEVEFTYGGTLSKPRTERRVNLAELRHVSKWMGLSKNLPEAKKQRHTLEDLFTIKRGLATGCNTFFIVTAEQISKYDLPKRYLQPILPGPKELENDEIQADEQGEPLIQNLRYLISCDLPEHIVKEQYPALWKYLMQGVDLGINKRYLCQHRKPWYSQEIRPPAVFICTYMGRPTKRSTSPFRFLYNHSKATAANTYLLLYPKPHFARMLEKNPDLYRKVWEALSSITSETLTNEGRVYGGGLHKLEPNELANIPADTILEAIAKETAPLLEDGEFLPPTAHHVASSLGWK
jgi:adenine-specific DNA-methyltransferase